MKTSSIRTSPPRIESNASKPDSHFKREGSPKKEVDQTVANVAKHQMISDNRESTINRERSSSRSESSKKRSYSNESSSRHYERDNDKYSRRTYEQGYAKENSEKDESSDKISEGPRKFYSSSWRNKEKEKTGSAHKVSSTPNESSTSVLGKQSMSNDLSNIQPNYSFTIQNRPEAPYMDWIRKGIKGAECRVNSSGFSKLRVGGYVQFHNRHEGILCEITYLNRYENFKKMVETEGVQKILPHVYKKHEKSSKEIMLYEAVKVYEAFPGSQRVHSEGALAIGVKYISEYFNGRAYFKN